MTGLGVLAIGDWYIPIKRRKRLTLGCSCLSAVTIVLVYLELVNHKNDMIIRWDPVEKQK